MSGTGHGHVFHREDGTKARCGGPGVCDKCNADMAEKNKVVQIEDHKPYIVAKALCLGSVPTWHGVSPCFKQWIATCPADTPLTKLECPECHAQNSFAVEIKP